MQHIHKIHDALRALGVGGVAPLHETAGPAVIFMTEDGKAYRVDYDAAPDDETLTKSAKLIEDIVGSKVEAAHPTRGSAERDKALAEAQAAAHKAAVEAAKHEPAPVQVMSAEEAKREHDKLFTAR